MALVGLDCTRRTVIIYIKDNVKLLHRWLVFSLLLFLFLVLGNLIIVLFVIFVNELRGWVINCQLYLNGFRIFLFGLLILMRNVFQSVSLTTVSNSTVMFCKHGHHLRTRNMQIQILKSLNKPIDHAQHYKFAMLI